MMIGVILGTAVVLCSSSWPFAWLGLELNLMCFVPAAMKDETLKKTCMFYFIAQSIGSLMILASGMLSDYLLPMSLILMFSLILKMGAVPLHFWVPVVVPNLEKPMFFMIQTWQKIAPISLIIMVFLSKSMISIMNVWVSAATMLSVSSPLFMVIFSGMVQMGWIFALSGKILWWFIMMYFIVLAPIVLFMQTTSSNFLLSLISGGGLPPFTGFMMKLNALKSISSKMGALLIMGSGLALSSYARILLNHAFKYSKISLGLVMSMLAGMV